MSQLKTSFSKEQWTYTGSELRPHFLLSQLGLKGSALGAFIGPCHVDRDHLIDWEDRLSIQDESSEIHAESMVHFIGEFFGITLREGVWLQRLFIACIKDVLEELGVQPGSAFRDGNDLYIGKVGFERKLSVSIVTASPVSVLMHAGVNVDASGAPVEAVGLNELKIPVDGPTGFTERMLQRFSAEWSSVDWACSKVRPVI